MSSSVTFAVGVVMCVASALSSVVGINIQKKSHMRIAALPPDEQQAFFKCVNDNCSRSTALSRLRIFDRARIELMFAFFLIYF